jgi:hypothetical protein
MLIIVDYRISKTAQRRLAKEGEVVLFRTKNVVYDVISGHPDIFMCPVRGRMVVSPQTADEILKKLDQYQISFVTGTSQTGAVYPESVHYNAATTRHLLIHHLKITDPFILKAYHPSQRYHVNQGYTRCSTLVLESNPPVVITSDRGVFKTMQSHFKVFFVNPETIHLEGFKHGFFGGCVGVLKNNIYLNGNPYRHPDGRRLEAFVNSYGFEIVALSDGQWSDVGSILFPEGPK